MHPVIPVAIAVLCAVAPPEAAAAPVGCPATLDGKRLGPVSLFDGPPADMAELAPEQRGKTDLWRDLNTTGRPVVLVCHYRGTARTVELTLPGTVRTCTGLRTGNDAGHANLRCVAGP